MPKPLLTARQRAIAAHYLGIVKALGYDPRDPHLVDTPARVARFLTAWHTVDAAPPEITVFANTDGYDEVVVTRGVRFYAVCAHHGVPFFGEAAVAYLPNKHLVGLSKMARIVDYFANRFTLQERITKDVALFMESKLKPRGVAVVLSSEHLCMSMRGVSKPGHRTVTSVMRGSFRTSAAARAELLSLLGGVR